MGGGGEERTGEEEIKEGERNRLENGYREREREK